MRPVIARLLLATTLLFHTCAIFAQVPSQSGMVPNTPPGVQANLTATIAPTVSNDATQGYQVGSLWQNASTGQIWIARSVAAGAAVWTNLELSDQPGYVVGNWYIPAGISGVNTGAAPGAGSIRLLPAYLKQRVTLNSLGIRINTLSAAGNMQAAIYANNPSTMRPTGNALASTASISTSAAGSLNSTVSIQLEPGLYWWATNCDNGTAVFSAAATVNGNGASLIGSATQSNVLQGAIGLGGLSVAQTFGTWPDLTAGSFSDVLGVTVPIVQFKIGSVP